MRARKFTDADSKTFTQLAISFYMPAADLQNGTSAVKLGDDATRIDASLNILAAFKAVRQTDRDTGLPIEPPTLDPTQAKAGVWLVFEDAAFNLLKEHWSARRKLLPPVLAQEVQDVNRLMDSFGNYSLDALAKAQKSEA